jgi:hypothetical protein
MGAKISGGSTGRSPEETKTERDDPWGCGSEKKYRVSCSSRAAHSVT